MQDIRTQNKKKRINTHHNGGSIFIEVLNNNILTFEQ